VLAEALFLAELARSMSAGGATVGP
jgi:hypothetical protein